MPCPNIEGKIRVKALKLPFGVKPKVLAAHSKEKPAA
jgi:hypothetical protein